MLQKKTHRHDLAKAISQLLKSPVKAIAAINNQNSIVKMHEDEALAYLLDNNLSKQQYLNMRSECKSRNADIWPRYDLVLAAKAKCHPSGLIITDVRAKVPLQNLIEHKVRRLIELQTEVIEADFFKKIVTVFYSKICFIMGIRWFHWTLYIQPVFLQCGNIGR